MNHPKLRIAWSVGWGIVCLLLITFWVRSFWRTDHVIHAAPMPPAATGQLQTRRFLCTLRRGEIAVLSDIAPFLFQPPAQPNYGWMMGGGRATDLPAATYLETLPTTLGFATADVSGGYVVVTPMWLYVSLVAAIAAAPWLRYLRFSLRTLLALMTATAIILGCLAYALRT